MESKKGHKAKAKQEQEDDDDKEPVRPVQPTDTYEERASCDYIGGMEDCRARYGGYCYYHSAEYQRKIQADPKYCKDQEARSQYEAALCDYNDKVARRNARLAQKYLALQKDIKLKASAATNGKPAVQNAAGASAGAGAKGSSS
jgi:hypothetical protein